MLLRFLRLFPAFVALERHSLQQSNAMISQGLCYTKTLNQVSALNGDLTSARQEIEDLLTEKRILEDRLTTALVDHDRMWEALQDALGNERFALRTQINHLTQRSGAGTPYQDAHRIPDSAVARPQEPGPIGRRGRVLPSQLARQQSIANIKRMSRAADDLPAESIAG